MNVLNYLFCNYSFASEYVMITSSGRIIDPTTSGKNEIIVIIQLFLLFLAIICCIIEIDNIINNIRLKNKNSKIETANDNYENKNYDLTNNINMEKEIENNIKFEEKLEKNKTKKMKNSDIPAITAIICLFIPIPIINFILFLLFLVISLKNTDYNNNIHNLKNTELPYIIFFLLLVNGGIALKLIGNEHKVIAGIVFAVFLLISIYFLVIAIKNTIYNHKNRVISKEPKKANVVIPIFISIFSILVSCFIDLTTQVLKPIIYIYPKEKTKVKIKVKYKEKLTCTYPKYEDGWEVEANPNGDLVDLKTNRKLYALYWEGIGKPKYNLKEGFIVEGNNVANFLEEKLEILGLNEREAEEFIVYWLPKLECNKFNYIRFSLTEEVNEYMPLEITPKPNTLIRILMQYKPLAFKINVNEQILPKQERKGYTIVEWGGTKI